MILNDNKQTGGKKIKIKEPQQSVNYLFDAWRD